MDFDREKFFGALKTVYAPAILVSLATLAVYLPSLQNGFVNWDDGLYVYENFYIRSIDLSFLKWAFLNSYGGNWHPLTLLSHAVDYALWGLNPFGHHLTSVVLHVLNTMLSVILVHRLLNAHRRIIGRTGHGWSLTETDIIGIAVITGLLFGLHPIHVESVAWISERKDVLCGLFFLLSLISYAGYAVSLAGEGKDGKTVSRIFDRRYLASLGLFILALLSKPMAVTLPVVLLLLDWFPFRMLKGRKEIGYLVSEKKPFWIVSLAAGIFTMVAQHSVEAVVTLQELPLLPRILVSLKALIGYLVKMLYPVVLIPHYPYPKLFSVLSAEFLLPIIVTAAITVSCLAFFIAKKQRLWLAVWLYYFITLLPVIGIIQVGEQSMADRYAYLPGIAPFLGAGIGVSYMYHKLVRDKRELYVKILFFISLLFLFGLMSYKTVNQTLIWRDGETLWTHEVKHEPAYAAGYTYRGDFLTEAGRYEEALADMNRAAEMTPESPDPFYYRGVVHMKQEAFVDAFADLTKAIALSYPPDYRHYRDRAETYMKLGRYDEAVRDCNESIRLSPQLSELYYRCGNIYSTLGRYEEAVSHFNEAIRLHPAPGLAYYNDRAKAWLGLGRNEEALKDFVQARRTSSREGSAKSPLLR